MSHLCSETGETEGRPSGSSILPTLTHKKLEYWTYSPVFSFPPQGEASIWELPPNHVMLCWREELWRVGTTHLPIGFIEAGFLSPRVQELFNCFQDF